jgi:homospermidine synthase
MIHFTFVGCGGVGFCLLELFKKENLARFGKFTIIEPREIDDLEKVMEGCEYIQVKEFVREDNYRQLLNHLDKNSFLVNVSVGVDSIMLIKLCVERGSHYIDTSLEVYENYMKVKPEEVSRYSQIMKNNLFHQNYLAEKIGEKDKAKTTRLISNGMNPGLISHFAKKALKEYARQVKGIKFTKRNSPKESDGKAVVWKGDYAKLAHDLGLREIQVVEFDSQQTIPSVKSTKECFVNSWSSIGFQEEASDLVMLSLTKEDAEALRKLGYTLIQPTEEKSNIYFVNRRGMNMERQSIALDYEGKPFLYKGRLIPHAEIISLSDFFKYNGKSPTIMYIYKACDEGMRGLDFFRENNYENLPDFKVLRREDVKSGWDSIGALLHFENGDKFGGWTICSINDAKKHGLISGATTLQVACYMLPCIMWALRNRKAGMLNAEKIPHKYIFQFANKYLGKIYFKKV